MNYNALGTILIVLCLFAAASYFNRKVKSGAAATASEDTVFKQITTAIKSTDPDDLEDFEGGIVPWISMERYATELDHLVDGEQIVLEENQVNLVIDYPLNIPFRKQIVAKDPTGFSRKDLVNQIGNHYHQIYKEEEQSTNIKVVPMDERKTLLNRNATDGKYGIWGHDLGDLVLSSIVVHKRTDGGLELELIVES